MFVCLKKSLLLTKILLNLFVRQLSQTTIDSKNKSFDRKTDQRK